MPSTLTTWLLALLLFFTTLTTWASEEGEFVKKGGRWQYVPTEDPGLRYLFEKGIISQQEFDRGQKILESRQQVREPGYSVGYGNGLNIKVGDKFLLKLRTQLQFRYNQHEYNQAWRLVGDANNSPEPGTQTGSLNGLVAVRQNDSSAGGFNARYIRLQFLG
jgi:hypothetical protein